jgi:hypothetical protein
LNYFQALFKLLGEFASLDTAPRTFWLGPLLHVLVEDPAHIEIVLNSKHCHDKPIIYGFCAEDGENFKSHNNKKNNLFS